jgi:translation initiation factor IF-2
MADRKDDKTAKAPTKTITLKRSVESGTVRQSFSHGRSKSVVVETVKRRTVGGPAKPAAAKPAAAAPHAETAKPAARSEAQKPSGVVLRTLTEEEREARDRALIDARSREAEERKHAEEDAKRRAAREEVERTEREAAEARKKSEEARRATEEQTKRKADEVAKKRFGEAPSPAGRTPVADEDDEGPRGPRRRRSPCQRCRSPASCCAR